MNTTELVFVLDRSGSMAGLEDDTIGGFNGMLKKQKDEQGTDVNVTTVLFDDRIEFIHDRFPISIVEPLTEKDYYVRGCTALLDAVGEAILKTENVRNHLPEEHRANKVIYVIITDGHENSSKKFSYGEIKRLIEAKKELGWEFLFLGANIDAACEAERIGIAKNRAVTYENDSAGVRLNYEVLGKQIVRACKPGSLDKRMEFDEKWADEIEEYRKSKRSKSESVLSGADSR